MKYRSKPVVIEAEQFIPNHQPLPFQALGVCCLGDKGWYIETLEGQMRISDFDFIIKGTRGEFYPCKPDVFEVKYEEVK